MLKTKLTALSISLLLSGCGATDYLQNREAANDIQKKITESDKLQQVSKSTYIERPPITLSQKTTDETPWWANKRVSIKGQNIPLNFIVNNIMRQSGNGVNAQYGPDVDQSKSISIDYQGDIKGALSDIASKADISVSLDANKIKFDRYTTKIFELNSLLGKSSFLFGRKANNSNDSGDGLASKNVSSSLGNIDTFSTTEISGLSAFDDYLSAIKSILKKDGASVDDKNPLDGDVIITESTASILVRTTPNRMKLIESYISSRKEAVSRQAMIEVKVLQFKGNKGSEFGIDWNVVRTMSNGKLIFRGPTLPSIGDSGNYGFSFIPSSPDWDGTMVLIKSLQSQGEVGVEYEPRAVARNNRVASIDNSEKISYIARVNVTPNQNADASVEVVDAVVSDGLTMSVMPNISGDIVNLQISGVLSKVLGFDETEINGVTVKTPQVQEIKFDQDVGLNYGETLVLNGYKQKSNKSDETTVFKVPFLGGNAGSSSTTETIVLITPKRI